MFLLEQRAPHFIEQTELPSLELGLKITRKPNEDFIRLQRTSKRRNNFQFSRVSGAESIDYSKVGKFIFLVVKNAMRLKKIF